MAKRSLTDIAKEERAEPESGREEQDLGKTRAVGVGLKDAEIERLDELADELGFARNAIMGWMIRYCLKQIEEGDLEIPVATERTIPRP